MTTTELRCFSLGGKRHHLTLTVKDLDKRRRLNPSGAHLSSETAKIVQCGPHIKTGVGSVMSQDHAHLAH